MSCHFLLQRMKVKSEVKSFSGVRLLVTPWTAGPPGSSVHGICQARIVESGAQFFFLTGICFIFFLKIFNLPDNSKFSLPNLSVSSVHNIYFSGE